MIFFNKFSLTCTPFPRMNYISRQNVLACSQAAGAITPAKDQPIHQEEGTMVTSVGRHGEQRKHVRSIKRYREDTYDVVVSATDVADDVGEDDFVASVD